MAEFRLKAVEDDTPSLVCEYDSLNRMMRDAYLYTFLKQGRAYHIMYDGKIVGGCMIKWALIRVSDNGTEHPFPACEISYLVIDKNKRRHGLGEQAMKTLLLTVMAWSRKIPIRYVTLEAFNEEYLLKWYKKFGFREYERAGKGSEYLGNISMYMDLAEPEDDFVSCDYRTFSGFMIRFTMIYNDEYTVTPYENRFPACEVFSLLKRSMQRFPDETALKNLLDWLEGIPVRFLIICALPDSQSWRQSRGFQKYQGNEYESAVYLDFLDPDEVERYAESR